jgi:hypothetical protein
MAKRHTDTRFIVQAIPTLFRLTGKHANAELRASMLEEKCKCGNPALITRTESTSTGIRIARFCIECIAAKIAPLPEKKTATTDTTAEIEWCEPTSFAERLLYPNGRPTHTGGFPNGTLQLR